MLILNKIDCDLQLIVVERNVEIFIITFVVFLIIILIMSLGVMLMNKNIKGSCGGLNAISGSDKCSVCNKDIDPNSPLITQFNCKRAQKI